MDTKTLKTMRINLVIFAVLHFIYVVAVATQAHAKPNVFGIFVQYWLSSWIIRKFVVKKKDDENKIILYTWLVSVAVFLARVLLGILVLGLGV